MIHVKRFVIEFYNDFRRTSPDTVTNTVFMSSFPRFSMTSVTGYWNFSVLCTCHAQLISCQYLFLKSGQCI